MALTLASIITKAREITGNKEDNAVGETMIPDAAIQVAIDPYVRDLSAAFGTASASRKRYALDGVAGQQAYDLPGDCYQVVEVRRQATYVPDYMEGLEFGSLPAVDQGPAYTPVDFGQQLDTLDVILGQRRARRAERYGWQISPAGKLEIWLVPTYAERIVVEYVATGFEIGDLPDRVESALVYSAVVAILDGIINRYMSDRATSRQWDQDGRLTQARLDMLSKQRDYYVGRRDAEVDKLRG